MSRRKTGRKIVLGSALVGVATLAIIGLFVIGGGQTDTDTVEKPGLLATIEEGPKPALTPLRLESLDVPHEAAVERIQPAEPTALPGKASQAKHAKRAILGDLDGFEISREDLLKKKNGVYGYTSRNYGVTLDRGKVVFATLTDHEDLQDIIRPQVTFEFESVRVGNDIIAKGGKTDADISLEDRSVSFERGSVEERYTLHQESLEQGFILSELPDARGEISITASLGTNLWEPADGLKGSGVTFEYRGNEFISIRKPVALDAAGRRLDLAISTDNGRLTITVPGEWVARAPLPIRIQLHFHRSGGGSAQADDVPGHLVGTDRPVASRKIDIACNTLTGERFVVWVEPFGSGTFDRDIYGQRVASDGSLVGGVIFIAPGPTGAYEPTVSYGDSVDRYLVAFGEDPLEDGSSSDQRINGLILNSDGSGHTPVFVLDDSTGHDLSSRVAFDGKRWLCVYSLSVGPDSNIRARFVRSDGVPGDRVDIDGIEGERGSSPSAGGATVEFGNGIYLVAWEKKGADQDGVRVVVARTLDPSGSFLTPITTVSEAPDNSSRDVDVSVGNGRFLVVWRQDLNPFNGGQEANQPRVVRGRIMGQSLSFQTSSFEIGTGSANQHMPSAAYSATNDEWTVVYVDGSRARGNIFGNRISASGMVWSRDRITRDGTADIRPELSWNSKTNEMLVVYQSNSNGSVGVGAKRFSLDLQVPSTPGQPGVVRVPDQVGLYSITWSPSRDTGGSGLACYELERSTDGGRKFALVASPTTNTFTETVESGSEDGPHLYRVRARDRVAHFSAFSPNSVTVKGASK